MRQRTAGVVGVAAVFLGGCGGSVEGTPVAELWDPCDISTVALATLGLGLKPVDSATQSDESFDWRFCTFENPTGFITLYATERSYDSLVDSPVAENAYAVDLQPAKAVQYLDPTGPACLTIIDRSFGAALVKASTRYDIVANPSTDELCDRSLSAARAMAPSVPS